MKTQRRLEGPNPSGFCFCGCGEKTALAKYTCAKAFKVKGTPMRYLPGHHPRTHGPGVPPGIEHKCDPEDVAFLMSRSWRVRTGYLIANFGGKKVAFHRVIMGVDDDALEVDHINGDTLDNRKCNLRIVSHGVNQQNRVRLNAKNTSGYRGVFPVKLSKSTVWYAGAKVNGKRYHIGVFKTAQEAGEAAKAWRLKHMPGARS